MEPAKIPTLKMKTDDIADLKKQYLEKLKNDGPVYAKIKELNLSTAQVNDNLATLIDFMEDHDFCAKCPGLEACQKAAGHYEMDIAVKDGYVDRHYSPCHVVTARKLLEARYLYKDFPEAWEDKDLRSVDMTKTRNPLIINLVKLQKGNDHNWIYVRGKYKSGRSYILACFSNSYAEDGHTPVAFCDSSTLVNELKDLSFADKKTFESRFDALCKAPLLVLDDFGNEFKSDFAFSSVLFPILNYRAKNDLLTLFTSDFSIDEIGEMYAQKVAPARGKQLANMLNDLCKNYILDGVTVYK
jgi:primosomal protein DnaI